MGFLRQFNSQPASNYYSNMGTRGGKVKENKKAVQSS